ncbi:MAG: RNA methyltransferase [Propionibacteriaceae bacterium]|jgi:TrmH family RNA methyltransferase|nr:RNA methyltransferase [Propionibacteriaceae bacterium]
MSNDITTTSLKLARRLRNRKFRSTAGEFLVEGAQAVREAVVSGHAKRVLASSHAAKQFPDLVALGHENLTPRQVSDLAETVTPQGIFAICTTPAFTMDDVFTPTAHLVVICSQIRDPGNLGTVIRCADAFGADGVILTTGSVDPTNPKTVRASVGSIFHLPIVTGVDLDEAIVRARASSFSVFAADGIGEDLNAIATQGGLDGKIAWIMGNEAWGLPHEKSLADQVVKIPMWGKAESLNLSTAAAVCLYITASRQRGAV